MQHWLLCESEYNSQFGGWKNFLRSVKKVFLWILVSSCNWCEDINHGFELVAFTLGLDRLPKLLMPPYWLAPPQTFHLNRLSSPKAPSEGKVKDNGWRTKLKPALQSRWNSKAELKAELQRRCTTYSSDHLETLWLNQRVITLRWKVFFLENSCREVQAFLWRIHMGITRLSKRSAACPQGQWNDSSAWCSD